MKFIGIAIFEQTIQSFLFGIIIDDWRCVSHLYHKPTGCKAPIMGFVKNNTPVHCGTRALHNDKGIYNPEIDGLNIPSGKRLHNYGNKHR